MLPHCGSPDHAFTHSHYFLPFWDHTHTNFTFLLPYLPHFILYSKGPTHHFHSHSLAQAFPHSHLGHTHHAFSTPISIPTLPTTTHIQFLPSFLYLHAFPHVPIYFYILFCIPWAITLLPISIHFTFLHTPPHLYTYHKVHIFIYLHLYLQTFTHIYTHMPHTFIPPRSIPFAHTAHSFFWDYIYSSQFIVYFPPLLWGLFSHTSPSIVFIPFYLHSFHFPYHLLVDRFFL